MPEPLTATSELLHQPGTEALAQPGQLVELSMHRMDARFDSAVSQVERLQDAGVGSLAPMLRESSDWLAEHGSSITDISLIEVGARRLLSAASQYDPDVRGRVNELVRAGNDRDSVVVQLGANMELAFIRDNRARRKLTYRIRGVGDSGNAGEQATLAQRTEAINGLKQRCLADQEPYSTDIQGMVARLRECSTEAICDRRVGFRDNFDDIYAFILGGQGMSYYMPERFSSERIFRAQVVEALYEHLPIHHPGDEAKGPGIYFDEHGRVQKITLQGSQPGLYLNLHNAEPQDGGDIDELSFRLGVEVDVPEQFYGRDDYGNQAAEPFVATEHARQIMVAFDQAGLRVNSRIEDSFTELQSRYDTGFSPRYGLGYADLTREVAKLINDRTRGLTHFFEGESSAEIADKVRSMPESADDPAAAILLKMLKQTVTRDAQPCEGVPVLTKSDARVSLRDGSCIDAEYYVAQGVVNNNRVRGAEYMIWSSYKTPTAINTVPVVFDGVEIPAGALFAKTEDGYVLMRMTSYAFSPEEATSVFGAQELKNLKNSQYRQSRGVRPEREMRVVPTQTIDQDIALQPLGARADAGAWRTDGIDPAFRVEPGHVPGDGIIR